MEPVSVGTYYNSSYRDAQSAQKSNAIWVVNPNVTLDATCIHQVILTALVMADACGRLDEQSFCIILNDGDDTHIDVPDNWDGKSLDFMKRNTTKMVSAQASTLNISADEETLKEIVESLTQTYATAGNDMPKVLHDAVFSISNQLNIQESNETLYNIDVHRTSYANKTIKVFARSLQEAQDKAFEVARDEDYSGCEYDADYSLD